MKLPATRPWRSRSLVAVLASFRTLAAVPARVLPSARRRLAWHELRNKLRAVEAFQRAAVSRSAAADGRRPVAAGRDDEARFTGLWRTEGAGFRHGAKTAPGPAGELPFLRDADPGALVPLHAGVGMALAIRALDRAQGGADLAVALDGFLEGARRTALPGWEGAVLESLGLTVRLRYPRWLAAVDRHLEARGEESRLCLWHGVGRAHYFLPTHLPPFRKPAGRSLERALAEPPSPAHRDQALAGLAQALTLVNLLHPEVVESFVLHHGGRLPASDAFEHGLLSAFTVWRWAAPDSPPGGPFADHHPRPDAEEIWGRRVRRPAREYLDPLAADLERRERRGELFLYRPLYTLPADGPQEAPEAG